MPTWVQRYFSQPPLRQLWVILPLVLGGVQVLTASLQLQSGSPLWLELPSLAGGAWLALLGGAELLPPHWMPLVRFFRTLALLLALIAGIGGIVNGIRLYNQIYP